MNETYQTNFCVAVNWLKNDFILCNKIWELDESVYENMMPVVTVGTLPEPQFLEKCPECGSEDIKDWIDGSQSCCACGHEWNQPAEEKSCEDDIFQWYLTDATEGDVEYLRNHFGLLFTYSNMLDLYVLCVTHYGTSWSYVDWTTDLKYAERLNHEKE